MGLPRLGRWLLLLVVAVVVSLFLVLLVTYRMMGDMSDVEINARWGYLLLRQSPAVHYAQQLFGADPPMWVREFALVWHRANPIRWWWLPFIFMGLRLITMRWAKRKSRF